MVAELAHNQTVVGSTPTPATNFKRKGDKKEWLFS